VWLQHTFVTRVSSAKPWLSHSVRLASVHHFVIIQQIHRPTMIGFFYRTVVKRLEGWVSPPAIQYSTGTLTVEFEKLGKTNTLVASCGQLLWQLISRTRGKITVACTKFNGFMPNAAYYLRPNRLKGHIFTIFHFADAVTKPVYDTRYYAIQITASQFLDKPRDASATVARIRVWIFNNVALSQKWRKPVTKLL